MDIIQDKHRKYSIWRCVKNVEMKRTNIRGGIYAIKKEDDRTICNNVKAAAWSFTWTKQTWKWSQMNILRMGGEIWRSNQSITYIERLSMKMKEKLVVDLSLSIQKSCCHMYILYWRFSLNCFLVSNVRATRIYDTNKYPIFPFHEQKKKNMNTKKNCFHMEQYTHFREYCPLIKHSNSIQLNNNIWKIM